MKRRQQKGFTLLEMLLVMAIATSILVAIMNYTTQRNDELRRDRGVMQIQQILNAGLAYYVNNSSWPTRSSTGTAVSDLSLLQGDASLPHYLPTSALLNNIPNPWAQPYTIGADMTGSGVFYVCSVVNGKTAYTSSAIIAGRLPMAQVIDSTSAGAAPAPCAPPVSPSPCLVSSTACTVISSVNIPGQNLNNARAVNFSGLYHPGACVPAPTCPGGMTPQIMVVPVSVNGVNSPTSAFPITGFTAYATTGQGGAPSVTPSVCNTTLNNNQSCPDTDNVTKMWRVCLRVDTLAGVVSGANTTTSIANPVAAPTITNPNWAMQVSVMALTRCMPTNEQTTFSVYGNTFNVPGGSQ